MTSSTTKISTTPRRADRQRAVPAAPIVFLPIYSHGAPRCPYGDVGEEIDRAFAALWGYRDGYSPPPTDAQVALLLAYLRYCLAAPVRRGKDYAWLRESAARSQSLADLYGLYDAAAAAGIVF